MAILGLLSAFLVICLLAGVKSDASVATDDKKSKFEAYIANNQPIEQKLFDEFLIGHFEKPEENFDLSALHTVVKDSKALNEVKSMINGTAVKHGVFDLLDYSSRSGTIKLYSLFSQINDWALLKKVVSYLADKVHPEQLRYALATSVFHRSKYFKFSPPNWFEVYPNYILPATTLRELYRRKMKGIRETVVYVNIANETISGKNSYFNAFSETDPEARLRYFRDDTGLSNMFLNWHLHFPHWRKHQENWEDRGHLFFFFHNQLLARYNLERINNGLEPVEGLSWTQIEMGRYVLDLLDNEGDPIPGRHAGSPSMQNTWWKRINDVITLQDRIVQTVDSNLVLNKYKGILEALYPGYELFQLGNTILGTDNSSHPEYYGSYFLEATDAVNIIGKGDIADKKTPGFFFKMLTTLRDPIFFQLLENIRSFFQSYTSAYLSSYKEIDEMYSYHGLSLDSVQINGDLSTYFEYEEIDVTKVIDLAPRETTDDIKYRAKVLKLNHKPFTYDVTVSMNNSYSGVAKGEKNAKVMFRLFLGPEKDSRGLRMDFQLSKHYFIEIDRFPIELEVGTNVVTRNSKDSSIYVDGELTYARVDDLIRQGRKSKKEWDLSLFKEISYCGLPNNLMLPKGDELGVSYKLIALITPFTEPTGAGSTEPLREFKSFPICGQPRFMDYWTGFPFDRIASVGDNYFRQPFAHTQTVTIYHCSNPN